jgi:hypothetical protein
MRPADELARFCSDTHSRLPFGSWPWAVAAVAGGTLIALIGHGWPDAPAHDGTSLADTPQVGTAHANATIAVAPAPTAVSCKDQTWPYLSQNCLKGEQSPKPVRVLAYEPRLAEAAIGATAWAAQAKAAARQPTSRHTSSRRKQTTHVSDRTRKVTVRSGRRDRPSRARVYEVTPDAYRAYGFAPR